MGNEVKEPHEVMLDRMAKLIEWMDFDISDVKIYRPPQIDDLDPRIRFSWSGVMAEGRWMSGAVHVHMRDEDHVRCAQVGLLRSFAWVLTTDVRPEREWIYFILKVRDRWLRFKRFVERIRRFFRRLFRRRGHWLH